MRPNKQVIAAKTISAKHLPGVLLLALVTLGLPNRAEAQVNVWTSNGPEGGIISVLAIDPVTPTTICAGTGAGIDVLQHQNQPPLADAGRDLIVEATGPDGALVTRGTPTGASSTESGLEPQA